MKFTQEKLEERLQKVKENQNINQDNQESLEKFYRKLRLSDNVGKERIYKYLSAWKTLFNTPKDKSRENFIPSDLILEEATKEEIEQVAFRIKESDYSDWSKSDFKVTLKKFYKTLYPDEIDRPDRIKKIIRADFLKKSSNIENKREIEALTASEVKEMSEQASNPRDKLLPVFMFEVGARIGEITGRDVSGQEYEGVRLKDVDLKEKYADLRIETEKNDKTERKSLALVRCVGLLQNWIENHPTQEDETSKLFVTVAQNNKGSPLGAARIKEILRELAEKAGIDKPITNHLFRHSSATYKGTELNWNQQRLMYWHGWKDEKMASKYNDQNEDRMKAERLEEEGIEDSDSMKDNALDIQECPRCGETVDPFSSFCPQCSLALDRETAQDIEDNKEPVKDAVIEELKEEFGLAENELEEKIREKVRENKEGGQ